LTERTPYKAKACTVRFAPEATEVRIDGMGQQIIFVQSCGDGREVRFAISWPMMARLDWNGKLRTVIYGRRFA